MNIQNKADRILDKVIDSQENKAQTNESTVNQTENPAAHYDSDTKVHPSHSDTDRTEQIPNAGSTVVNEHSTDSQHEEASVPPKPKTAPHNAQALQENPHQNFIYAAVSAVVALLTLFLIPMTLLVTPATILFGISALLYSRKSERDGWNTWVPKFLGWATMLTGAAALFFGMFVTFIVYIVKMT